MMTAPPKGRNPICKGGLLVSLLTLSMVLCTSFPTFSQELFEGSKFIEDPDGTYRIEMRMPEADLQAISEELQARKKKRQVEGNEATINMSYTVIENALIGRRPFGRIRYNIHLELDGDHLSAHFKDFSFKKIERSARYGKLEEVGGRPKDMISAKELLSDTQWQIIRWKTEGVVQRKVAMISSG